jgi:ubiquitin-activating enzyme E1
MGIGDWSFSGRNINLKIKMIALDKLGNTSSEDIFADDFWSNIDITILAVDNVLARQYIDKKCLSYNIKLIEAGAQRVNASSSLIIPNLTG